MMNATYSPDDNKLRLYASQRLDSETYARVKAAGFRWAPKQELFVAPTWSPEREDLLLELCGEIGDEDTTLTDRAEERAERFEDYGEKRLADAERARKAVAAIADNIPFGQPILVGHHSEKHARRDAAKIDSGMRKAVKMWRTSQYWEERAAGALRHAKYKELPAVRHRRIKTIESEKRKLLRTIAESAAKLKLWSVDGLTLEQARKIANFANPGVCRREGSQFDYWNAWDVLQPDGERYSACPSMTVEAVQEAAKRAYTAGTERRERWLEHYDNRLAYERAMLAEQLGDGAPDAPSTMGDRFAFAVGGEVFTRGEWLTVIRVNRVGGAVNSITHAAPRSVHWSRTWKTGVESISDYRAPTAEQVAKVKAATKLPPICNYPGEGFREMTEAEWSKRNQFSDFPYIGKVAATETHGAHRRRQMPKPGEYWKAVPVFITDAKRVDPPAIKPPSEPKEAAEFVREFVAPPESMLSDALALAEEIGGACNCVNGSAGCPAHDPAVTEPSSAADDIAETLEEAPAGMVSPHVAQWAAERAADIPPPVAADFAAPPRAADFEAMAATLRNGGVQVVSAPQLFPTPQPLAEMAAEIADLQPGQRLLEPSAGTGSLLDVARRSVDGCLDVVAVEINGQLAQGIARRFPGVTVINADFLDMAGATPDAKFDRILMNPPFERGADIRHIEHARTLLKPGGRLVAICANGPRQRERLQPIATEWRDLPAGTFKASGTNVNTALLVIDAPPA